MKGVCEFDMKVYVPYPIDIVDEKDVWLATYRYEPFLDKWFYIKPGMKNQLDMYNTEDIPEEILTNVEKMEFVPALAYSAPLKLQVQLNKTCNYRCKMCYAFDKTKLDEKLEFTQIISMLSDVKNAGVIRINYVGGEVFMRRDFSDIVLETKKHRLLVSCITNGIIPGMDLKRYQPVLDMMYNVQVSCNGIGESYEYEYGCKDWGKASRCIANTISHTESNILSFVISENNYRDIPAFLEYANAIKPTVVKFGTICWSGNSKGKETIKYYKEVLPEAARMIENGREKYSNLQIQSQLDKEGNTPLWEDYLSGYRPFEFYFSPEGRDALYLKSDGFYYPFPLLSDNHRFCLGKIEDGISNIWNNSEVLNEIRSVSYENSECNKIGCKAICGLWNRSYAYSWTGNLKGKIPCEVSKWA